MLSVDGAPDAAASLLPARGAGRRDEARAHLREAVAAFADVGAGEPEIWRLTEW